MYVALTDGAALWCAGCGCDALELGVTVYGEGGYDIS